MKLLIAALALALLAAPAAVAAREPARTLTEAADGRQIVLGRGETLRLRLESNGTTGYSWEVAELPRILKRTGDRYVAPSAPPGGPPMAGAGGSQEFTFASRSAGRGTLRLVYRQPWDRKARPDRSFRLSVRVR
ncbi:MAG TPA: protease inhibitor I42 family protein [Allosphingosinicella sp.]